MTWMTPLVAGMSAWITVASPTMTFPFAAEISSGYGNRSAPCRGCSSYHRGLDFAPGYGTELFIQFLVQLLLSVPIACKVI